MMKASPSAMSSPNALITADVQAGNAPMCSGSTTCCATTSALAFNSAQDASCDSRTMVEKPVRNSEFCISCTMPERLALTTSSSMESMGIDIRHFCRLGPFVGAGFKPAPTRPNLRHDQILPFIHPRRLARADHRRAVELIQDRRSGKAQSHIQPLALINRTLPLLAVEPHAPRLLPRIRE